ncbi:MAG: hypothetical protein H7263_12690 [Candidatus Sericytochromatia bacterium]|nr:hypothetical protein [Candidatus Sericytochromatia bacterium]
MEEFSKYFKSMLEQLMKSGTNESGLNFDVKAFDLSNGSSIMQMFFGGMTDKKEKLAIRKLTEQEIEQYKSILESRDKLQYQFRRLMTEQKKLDADFDLFWQDAQEISKIKLDPKQLSVDLETGFLFQEVNVNQKSKEEEV